LEPSCERQNGRPKKGESYSLSWYVVISPIASLMLPACKSCKSWDLIVIGGLEQVRVNERDQVGIGGYRV
jgi:hypothetical protein